MNEDRELLEKAALAVGIRLWWHAGKSYFRAEMEFPRDSWNPLTDDGDALRLAVKLRMDIDICESDAMTRAYAAPAVQGAAEDFMDDPSAATRRAIVRAAAEVGSVMSKSKIAFEAWASHPDRHGKLPIEVHENGAYKDSRTYAAYYGWRASREQTLEEAVDMGNFLIKYKWL